MGINSALYNGLSGLNSYSTGLSTVSDNVANANTTGFKSSAVRFGDLVSSEFAMNSNDVENQGAGSTVLGVVTDFSQGTLLGTSNWSDMAITGNGFFVVKESPADGETNTDGQEFYTRDGSFHLDAEGFLVNQQGYRVQGYAAGGDAGGGLADIQVENPDTYVKFYVTTDGVVTGIDQNGDPVEIATVGLAGFSNDNGLVRYGSNLYTVGPEAGTPFYNGDDPPNEGYFGEISGAYLESSNVDLASEMVNMIIYQASYNANSKTITTSSELVNTSINMIR